MTDHAEKTLLPCPFCGGEASAKEYNFNSHKEYEPYCTQCSCFLSVHGIDKRDPRNAIKQWNTRARPAVDVEALKCRHLNGRTGQPTDYGLGYNDAIDHLASAGYLASPLEVADLENLCRAVCKCEGDGDPCLKCAEEDGWNQCIDHLAENGYLNRTVAKSATVAASVEVANKCWCDQAPDTHPRCEPDCRN